MTIKNLGNAAGGAGGSVSFSAGAASAALGSIVFSNSNGVSFGLNGSTVTGSVAATANPNFSAGTTSSGLNSVVFSNSNGISFGLNGSTITAQGGGVAIAGSNSTFTSGTVVMSNAGGALTISNGAQSVLFSVPATSSLVGASGLTVSTAGSTISVGNQALTRFFVPPADNLTPVSAAGNASISFQYVSVPIPVTATRIDALISHSGATSATTNTCAIALSMYAAIYTKNAASLSSLSSGSTQTTWTYASNSGGLTDLTLGKIMPISVPINVSMTQGEYIVGFNFVTATSSIGLSTTNLAQTFSMMGGNLMQSALVYGEVGSNVAASSNLLNGMGVYSAASTGLSGAYSLSGIVMTGSSLSQANIALVFRNA